MTVIDRPTSTASWTSWHCFVYWAPEHLDDFLTGTLGPFMTRLRTDGLITDWFFIRYGEDGPHVRVRARCVAPGTVELRERLSALVAAASYPLASAGPIPPRWHRHGEVRDIPYVAEIDRYGGDEAMPVAEQLFARSTEVALAIIEGTPLGSSRLTAAADLARATAIALGLDDLAAARWLRTNAAAWRWVGEGQLVPPAIAHRRLTTILESRSAALTARWERVSAEVADPASVVSRWAGHVRSARERLEGGSATDSPVPKRWAWVWASQLHMLFNRIGVVPEEERSVCWLLAASLLAPSGMPPFFDDDAQAVDRRYQEASKYAPGLQAQLPHTIPAGPRPAPPRYTGRSVSLAANRPGASLGQALLERRSARGQRLVGPLANEQLGTLLWASHETTERLPPWLENLGLRAYPSAGAAYAAVLRLLVYDVSGVAPGTYQVDAANRQLWRLGDVPSRADLAASSMWFAELPSQRRIDVTDLPAMLGLYLEHGRMREVYGLRALRFALLEAGHLAQNLALVAAATDIGISTIGGFYDDLAHELFGLDGVDEVMAYLIPIGKLATSPPDPANSAGLDPAGVSGGQDWSGVDLATTVNPDNEQGSNASE